MSDYTIHYGRKRKGIRLQLKNKINDWLESIEDEEIRKLAKRDTIVTGGSITSMFMGDKINDYDIYFKTKETVLAVAKYYVEQFNNTVKNSSVNDYKPEVRSMIITEDGQSPEERIYIFMQSAGVASEKQNDYGYFETMSEDDAVAFAESMITEIKEEEDNPEKKPYRPVFISRNAITLSDKVQLVIRFYGEPEEIHKNYDFVHATGYWDHQNEDLVVSAKALECMLSRTLIYQGSLYPVATIFRAKKFIERGWRITAGQLLKIMWQISELDLKNMEVLQEQLTGVDMAYMWELIQVLQDIATKQGGDFSNIDSLYVSAIIDKIFD